jgi:hypothetical protein
MNRSLVTAVAAVLVLTVAVEATSLLQPLWSTQLPSTAVPPTGTSLGWSLFAPTTGTDGFYITSTADHTMYVLSSANASVEVAWSYSAWNDNVTSSVAYSRSYATASLPETGATTLLVLRGAFLHVFDLKIGYLIGVQNVTLHGEVPTTIESVTTSKLLLQYNDYVAVVDGYGNIKWSQPMLAGNDVRTYAAADASYIALVQPVFNDPAGDFGVSVLTTNDGSLVYRATFHASTIQYFFLMVVESASLTFLIIQNGQQFVSRFMFDGTELYSLQVMTNIWGYGVEAGQLVLQVEEDPGLTINFYNYTNAALIAQTGLIPQTVAGQGHIVGEPEYALLAFVTNSTQFHLTGWTATNGANRFNFTFDFSGAKHSVVAAAAPLSRRSTGSMTKKQVGYSADANIMMANWAGQIFVPGPLGFHYVDGNRAALDDTYKASYSNIVFPATALTNNVLVVVSGSTVSAFELL